ncbi:unnamed protein product [Ambrosiozyma monospora]|uniref:Unnamed protein product n=1 Tax=Ambrosiozyma monospora TaxID=43982 RepID=A0A9W6YRZ9_AMBMO|nr:unnamed protein product [Ambrosiozyma monospora]
MINSTRLSKVLSQLLTPTPEITDSSPYSVSLLSIPRDRALLTASNISVVKRTSRATSHLSPSSSRQHLSNGNGKYGDLLQFSSSANYYGSAETVSSVGSNKHSNASVVSVSDPLKSNDVKLMKEYLAVLKQNQTSDLTSNYVNMNINPTDDLNMIAQAALRIWNANIATNSNPWLVAQMETGTMLYFYKVNEEFVLLMACDSNYPKGFAIKKLQVLSQFLADKL